MNEAVEASGSTVEEAIDRALAELQATDDEVEIQILAEGGPRGILGRKVDLARVRVKRRDERTEEDFALLEDEQEDLLDAPPSPELLEQADAAAAFLEGLLDAMQLEGEVHSSAAAGVVAVDIAGPEMGLLIGRRGSTLEALQELVRAAVQRRTSARPRLSIDIEGYRARQRAALERKALDAATRVRRSRRPVSLEPMTSYQRKVVHDALAAFAGVVTSSEGEEPDRRVVIRPESAGPVPRGRPARMRR